MMMNLRITSLFSFVSLSLIHPVFLYSTETENEFLKRCPPFPCGKFGEISFPFSNRTKDLTCSPFLVDGCDDEQQWIKLTTEPQKRYKVENISKNHYNGWNITITDTYLQKLLNSRSCEAFNNLSDSNVHTSSYKLMPSDSITLLKCNLTLTFPSPHLDFEYRGCPNFNIYYNDKNKSSPQPGPPPTDCAIVNLPVNLYNSYDKIFELLTATFSLQVVSISRDCYFCELGEGICQFNYNDEFKCSRGNKKGRMVIIIALIATAAGIGILIITFCYLRRRKVIFFWKKKTQDCKSIEAFLRSHGPLALKRYRYSEVKKMTGTFKTKLGQGGYGSVFKGVLPDGCLVAVKVLKKSKSNGEEFINEAASISRTSHINIVTLLGFCFEGSKRALVYEFIANGSLEKYICEENSSKSNHLGWETLFDIAVGIARGLEYLHRGCNTRILHFDIKPHNILLDENFCPKISDFGLAKVCTKRESIISMKDARGTIGYIAPEVFLRNIGGVSHKSDVYSYGMLVLEMVGGRKNISVEADNTSEIYFPDWIYRRLEVGKELGLGRINNEEEKQIARKMVLVSLWCIQTDPSNRPPMSRVVEMLHGSGTSLPIPPKPYLFSPFRPHLQSMADFSTTIVTN